MKPGLLIIVLALHAFFLCPSCRTLAITDTNVLDSHTGSMLPHRTIIVKRDRIAAIGKPGDKARKPLFAKVIKSTGKYVIPGLIDAHAHLVFLLDEANVKGEEVMPLYLGNGVTTVRDIGDGIVEQKRVGDFANSHPATCPTVFLCSPLIDGAHPFHGADRVSAPITDPASVPAFVDSMVAYGVSTLKIYVYAKPDVFKKVIEEGHKHGLTVSAHLPSNMVRTEDALDWGIDVIEHIFGAPDDSLLIQQMAAQGTMFDPTLVCFKNMLLFNDQPEVYKSSDNSYMPRSVQKNWASYRESATWIGNKLTPKNFQSRRDYMKKYKEATARLYRAGVTLLAGTDSPEPYCPPGFSLQTELTLLVESGLPPAEAIRCATINNAKALKKDKELGSIETGKIADMIILNENPLTDIRNTRSIQHVIHRGIVCDPKQLLHSSQVVPANSN